MTDQDIRALVRLLKKCTPEELIKIFKQLKDKQ
jgi:hypothetical protein